MVGRFEIDQVEIWIHTSTLILPIPFSPLISSQSFESAPGSADEPRRTGGRWPVRWFVEAGMVADFERMGEPSSSTGGMLVWDVVAILGTVGRLVEVLGGDDR